VIATTIAVTKAGDGLSTALSVEPTEFRQHETVYVVLETTVSKVTYKDAPKNEDASVREHVLATQHAAIVDGQAVAALMAETKRKVAEMQEREREAKGIITLPGTSIREESE
jgi:hypothetical protein